MSITTHGWQVLDEGKALLIREYSIGPGNTSNCVVARVGDGELMVLSPTAKVDDGALKDLEAFGTVTSLVAPNGFHRTGLRPWLDALPHAAVYGPQAALPRVRAMVPAAQDLQGLADRMPEGLALLPLPSMRVGGTWLVAETDGGLTWCVGDTITNQDEYLFGIGWMLKLVGIKRGFAMNGLQGLAMARDKPAYFEWLRARLSDGAPTTVVPAHGTVVERADLGETLSRWFAG